MAQSPKKIILGSNSPRRRELMAGLDLEFTIDTSNTFEESMDEDVQPSQIPVLMAKGKSHGFHRPLDENEVLVTADTVVLVDGKVLGKPHSREQAIDMLRELSGKTHRVINYVITK